MFRKKSETHGTKNIQKKKKNYKIKLQLFFFPAAASSAVEIITKRKGRKKMKDTKKKGRGCELSFFFQSLNYLEEQMEITTPITV